MPVGFVFDTPRLLQLRQRPGMVAGTLDVRAPAGRLRTIRSADDWFCRGYRVETVVLDGDGNPTGERLRTVARTMERDPLSGEVVRRRARLTVVGWEDVVVFGDMPLGKFRALTPQDAVACGCGTVTELQDVWRETHPSSMLARLFWFMLGDRRDQLVWLAPARSMVAGRQGDYTSRAARELDADAPVLSDGEMDRLRMHAHQKDVARRLAMSRQASEGSLAERVARLAR